MIVCVCNAIKEREVREAARQGAHSARTLFRHVGRRPKCAQCLNFAESILADETSTARSNGPMLAGLNANQDSALNRSASTA